MASPALAVAAGGALGAWLRYLVAGWVQRAPWPAGLALRFPVGTFVVNVSGCLLLGLLAGLFHERYLVAAPTRAFLLIGLLGGYTTFSTFALETVRLLEDGSLTLALVNGLGGPVVGVAGAWIGTLLARWSWA